MPYTHTLKRVFVNGYGSIGRRIAAFVSRDDELEIVGVGKNSTRGIKTVIQDGFSVYLPESKVADARSDEVGGSIESALDVCDLVIDCTPGGTGYRNKTELYEPRGIIAIYQGGESMRGDSAVSDILFNSRTNYDDALGKSHVIQGSCNVTGIGKILAPLGEHFEGITRADITLVRRWADIEQDTDVPDTIEMTPSPHHADDVIAHMGKRIPIYVRAIKVPTRQMHVHIADVRFSGDAPDVKRVHDALGLEQAVAIVWGAHRTRDIRKFAGSSDALADTNMVHVHAEMTQSRGDTLQIVYSDDQTGIVIPENHMLLQAMLFKRPYADALKRTQSLFRLADKKAALEAHFSAESFRP